MKSKVKKEKKRSKIHDNLLKSGFSIGVKPLKKRMIGLTLILNIIITSYFLIFFAFSNNYSIWYIILILVLLWTLGLFLIWAFLWLSLNMIIDLRIFNKKTKIEEVLPDFLLIAATNIRAGMPIDQSLWLAVRPKFGVLSKEIEIVAKEVMSGSELTDSLKKFGNKYDSDVLEKSINLLTEGINSGGEIGNLLTKIAKNIQQGQLMRKEMAADVTSYVIFITFASIFAAPMLLALAGQLIIIVGSIVANLSGAGSGNMLQISNISINKSDFNIFASLTLMITAFFSAIIVATIKKGSIKSGIRYIPIFMIVSIFIYFVSAKILGTLLGGMF